MTEPRPEHHVIDDNSESIPFTMVQEGFVTAPTPIGSNKVEINEGNQFDVMISPNQSESEQTGQSSSHQTLWNWIQVMAQSTYGFLIHPFDL